jgi:hypothetical protein
MNKKPLKIKTMKKMILTMASAMLFIFTAGYSQAVSNQTAAKPDDKSKVNGPVAKFDKMSHSFGEIPQSTPVTTKFLITNDGNEPLVIASAKASCGCTTPSYTQDPVLPGKTAEITVSYNAAVLGDFNKTVTVKTNAAEQPVVLRIDGKVIPKK